MTRLEKVKQMVASDDSYSRYRSFRAEDFIKLLCPNEFDIETVCGIAENCEECWYSECGD